MLQLNVLGPVPPVRVSELHVLTFEHATVVFPAPPVTWLEPMHAVLPLQLTLTSGLMPPLTTTFVQVPLWAQLTPQVDALLQSTTMPAQALLAWQSTPQWPVLHCCVKLVHAPRPVQLTEQSLVSHASVELLHAFEPEHTRWQPMPQGH